MSFDSYVFGQVIGEGSFGVVRQAQRRDTSEPEVWPYAIKEINTSLLNSREQRSLAREIEIMRRVQHHPHIVGMTEAFSVGHYRYLVLDRADTVHRDLFDDIVSAPGGRLSSGLAMSIFAQVVSAVAWCDCRGTYHRDLKPENLLLEKTGRVLLTDFGFAKCTKSPAKLLKKNKNKAATLHTACGSPHYVSPELLTSEGSHLLPQNEVWSLGIVLFAMVTGFLPFDDDNWVVLTSKICQGAYDVPPWVPRPIVQLLHAMLVVDVQRRITIAQLAEHPLVRLHYKLYELRQRHLLASPQSHSASLALAQPQLLRRSTV